VATIKRLAISKKLLFYTLFLLSLTLLASNVTAATVDTYTFIAQWGTHGEGQGQFNQPKETAIDGNNIYVIDTSNNRIQKFTTEGTFVSTWPTSGEKYYFTGLFGIAVDSKGYVYISDPNGDKVQKFNRCKNTPL
jgi:DNA-binding beta-propeller fold protein YncE